jgi:hypothetical protein
MSDIAKKVLWSISLSIPTAVIGVILRGVFQAWGIFDQFSQWLGGWLKMHVTPAQIEWTIAASVALLAYAGLLWIVWRYHRAPRSVIVGDQANFRGIVGGHSRWPTRFGIGIGIGICVFFGLGAWLVILDRGSSEPPSPKNPDLRRSISEGGNVFIPVAEDLRVRDRFTGIALKAKIWNVGAPSVAIEWSLFVIPQNVTPVVAQLTTIPESLRLEGPINSVIRASDSLEAKTKTVPVKMTPVEGVLLFVVPLTQEIVLIPSTRLELTVKDINGIETKVSKLIGDWPVWR